MDVKQILELADELISGYTGESLDYWQKVILEGTLNGKTYSNIADETYASESHVRFVGSKLWKTLSEIFNEHITKKNLKAILENGKVYTSIARDNVANYNINICTPEPRSSPNPHQQKTPIETIIDLDKAPAVINFFGRDEELSVLSEWVAGDRLPLISLVGLNGIGKTTLALRLIDRIKTNFNCIIYRSLCFSPSLKTTLTNILETLSPETKAPEDIETLINQVIKKLQASRCFIVLDDLHNLFKKGKLAGQYASVYEDYSQFFKLLAGRNTNSCLLLISREKSIEISTLERENPHYRCLQLGGLGESAREILASRGLTDDRHWNELVNLYSGNPSWLKIIAATVEELFNGSAGQLLSCPTLFLGDLEPLLEATYQRLSESEKVAIAWLAARNAPVEIVGKPKDCSLSQSAFWKAIQSLTRRCLVEKVTVEGGSRFGVVAAVGQFVKERDS